MLGVAKLAQLGFFFMAARVLGPGEFGYLSVGLGLTLIFGQAANFGWPLTILRLVPRYQKKNQRLRVAQMKTVSVTFVLGASLLFTLFAAGGIFYYGNSALTSMSTVVAATLLPNAVRRVYRQKLAAYGRSATAFFLDEFVPYATSAVLVFLLAALNLGNTQVLAIDVGIVVGCSHLLALVFIVIAEHIVCGDIEWSYPPRRIFKAWIRSAGGYSVGLVSQALISRSDSVFLPAYVSSVTLGLFGAAQKLAILITLPQVAINAALNPLISAKSKEGSDLRELALFFFSASFFFSSFVGVILWLTSPFLIALLFGEDFAGAIILSKLLIICYFVQALTMAAASFCSMSNYFNRFAAIYAKSVAVIVVGCILLMPRYGAYGLIISLLVSQIYCLSRFLIYSRRAVIESKLEGGW